MQFSEVCDVFDRMEATRSRLSITDELAKLFSQAKPEEMRNLVYLCQGVVAPEYEGIEVGIGDKIAAQAIARVAGVPLSKVDAEYRSSGDLGFAAAKLFETKFQKSLASSELTVIKVHDNFYRMATASGTGSQEIHIKLLCELLSNSTPSQAKTIVRFCTDNMRIGLGEPTIIDALSFVFAKDKSLRAPIERAFNLTSDLGLVAEVLFSDGGLEKISAFSPIPGNPIRPALAERLENAEDIIERLGKCAVEGKYDGFRVQVHKLANGKVEFFSRKQERITHMFPELTAAVKSNIKAKEAILEGEAVGVDPVSGKILPFQVTVQRKRKHGIGEISKKIPLKLFCFELLFADGTDYTNIPYEQRRKKLESIVKTSGQVSTTVIKVTDSAAELESFFKKSLADGLEGIVAKDLKSPYVAGARKFAWIKMKKSYAGALSDTVDVVIIGFYYGKGKRTKFGFGGVLTAVWDGNERKFKSVAKVGTGFSEEQMAQYEEMLRKDIVPAKPIDVDSLLEPDEWVKPSYVIEVNADEITKSPVHTAGRDESAKEPVGLALRFPRLVKLRDDKAAKDATTVEEILEMFEGQGKKGFSRGK